MSEPSGSSLAFCLNQKAKGKTSYHQPASLEHTEGRIPGVIEEAEPGDVGKTLGQPEKAKPVGQIGAPAHFSFFETER